MEEIERDRSSRHLVIQKIRDVKSHHRVPSEFGDDCIVPVVEDPGVVPAPCLAPRHESRMEPFRVRGIEKLQKPREAPCGQFQSQRAAQRLVEIRLLPNAQEPAACWPNQNAQPALQELHVVRCRWQLQGIEARALAVPEWAIFTAKSPDQNLKAPILIEDDLHGALPLEHRHEESDEHRLSGAGRTANQGVPSVFARAAFRIGRIACVKREVEGRSGARHQERKRLTPVIARGTSCRVVMKRHHACEITRADRRLADTHGKVAGQLSPERRLKSEILACDRHARVRKDGSSQSDTIIE